MAPGAAVTAGGRGVAVAVAGGRVAVGPLATDDAADDADDETDALVGATVGALVGSGGVVGLAAAVGGAAVGTGVGAGAHAAKATKTSKVNKNSDLIFISSSPQKLFLNK